MKSHTDALRPIQEAFLRAFTGSNRTALAEQAFIAGWNAAKRSDQTVYDSIAARYSRDVWEQRKAKAWAARDMQNCHCDHNEYCGKCWPIEFRKGGEFYEWTGTPCQLCDAKPGQEHAPACPRHPSDPMRVRRAATPD